MSKGRKPWTPPAPLDLRAKQTEQPHETSAPKRQAVSDCVVEEVPAACPRCHSTDREQMEGTITRKISGMTQDGRLFTRVRWAYATCRNCDQRYRIIRRENDGD